MSTSTTSLTRVPSASSNSLSSSTRSMANSASSLIQNPSTALSNAASSAKSSSIVSNATSILPKLNLTPQKQTGSSPFAQSPAQPVDRTPMGTPGKWEHPRMNEIIRRRNANKFDASNVRIVLLNTALMVASFGVPRALDQYLLPRSWQNLPYQNLTLNCLRAVLVLFTILATLPLFQPPDACEDIPLTPAQRQLLNLPPMSRPATPLEQSQYATPPRYSASPSSSSMGSRTPSGSPLGSPAIGGGRRRGEDGERRRLSYTSVGGRSSPLGMSDFDSLGSAGMTSSPSKGGKASVGLNSKWLYEKGRGSPRSSLSGSGGFL